MATNLPYFPDAQEADLSEGSILALRCMRQTLAESPPANVIPDSTLVRWETGGNDFILPHSKFNGFGMVVRVGELSRGAQIAYSSCKRPDRGDEFDAAFNSARKKVIAEIESGEFFCRDLTGSLLEYLRRRLLVVQDIGLQKDCILQTRILWPSIGNPEDNAPLLWKRRSGIALLRSTEERRAFTGFDEQAA